MRERPKPDTRVDQAIGAYYAVALRCAYCGKPKGDARFFLIHGRHFHDNCYSPDRAKLPTKKT